MRSSKKRKVSINRETMRPIQVWITHETYRTLDTLSGPNGFGWTIEQLTAREMRRRLRKVGKETHVLDDFAC